MTDRVRMLTVILDADYRGDDVESIVNAIQMVRGVAEVTTTVVTSEEHLARMAARTEIRQRITEAVQKALGEKP